MTSGTGFSSSEDAQAHQSEALRAYLELRPALRSVLDAAAKRFRTNNGLRGAVSLGTIDTREAVQGIGARTERYGTLVTLQELDRVFLEETRFAMPLVDVLAVHLGAPVITRADATAARDSAWTALCAAMRDAAIEGAARPAGGAIDDSRATPTRVALPAAWASAASLVESWLIADEAYLRNLAVPAARAVGAPDPARQQVSRDALLLVARALGGVESLRTHRAVMALPVFAQHVCGDPHGLDADRIAGRLFERALSLTIPDTGLTAPPANAEERELLFSAANLAVDELSSTVAVYHLLGEAPLLHGARAQDCVVTLPLATVNLLTSVGAHGQVVFVVENPAVFMGLLHAVRDTADVRRPTIVCTSGNLSLASRRLLDLLVRSGATIRYSGDFDQRGLAIARGLARRWPAAIVPWRMDVASYRLARGNVLAELPETLDACIAAAGPAYQEAILPILVQDLAGWMQAG